ncbi:MAG: phasin family protein [Pseudomonadota bacterium]|nr:phasin family protein [Pseudomonadota bacterium]
MSDTTFDPKNILETYKSAFAPVLKAQQEGVRVLDRVGRYQYAVAGEYLEWSLAQAKLAFGAQTPADFLAKQAELTTGLSEKLRARAQEFATLASESQATFTDAAKDMTSKVAEESKKFEEPKKFDEQKRKAG